MRRAPYALLLCAALCLGASPARAHPLPEAPPAAAPARTHAATPSPAESSAPRARLGRGLLASLGLGLLAPAALTAAGAGISWAAAGRDEVDLLVGGFAGFQLGVAVAWLVAPYVVDLAMGQGRYALAGALAGLGAGLVGAVAVYALAFLVGASAPLLAVAGAVALLGPSLGVVAALQAGPAPASPAALAFRF